MSTPRPVVYVTQPVHPRALDLLAGSADVVLGYGDDATPLDDVLPVVEGILVRTRILSGDEFRRAPNLRVVARHGVGVDNIAVADATDLGILVANTPDANMKSVAEHVFALLLAVKRRLVTADAVVRGGRFEIRDTLVGSELGGHRLGVIGMGRIGTRVARIAGQGFGMDVVGFDPYLSAPEIRQRGAEPVEQLGDLFRTSDVVTVHVPLTAETRGMIGAAELAELPPHAVLIHTARGGVVDEEALIDCLRRNGIAGAGVDVFEAEPPPSDCGYFGLPNVVMTPHTAAHTEGALERMSVGAAEAIVAVLGGGRPAAVVNPAVFGSARTRAVATPSGGLGR
ncbi:hydroxyacid dehydrogenase [Blastococcus capsensis]|uniref:hydroxyacid dehydrogenase n=1 Tax=Blastococcus capsensis TaxID=1564163 RepID=UPI0025421C5C|nr:hydroxyacid dehydrogenase [Blastococcus capsensis]MDK3258459.1 hydroxyacid dehydrogenase [Blastococcus capsensis]